MSKITAAAKNVAGNIQEGVGKVFNSESMVAKGEQKQLEADQQKVAAEQKNSGNAHSAKGAAKQNVGEATHNPHMAAQGGAERYQGNAQHNTGRLNDPAGTTGAGLTGAHHHETIATGTHPVNSHAARTTNPTDSGYTGATNPLHSDVSATGHHTTDRNPGVTSTGVPTAGATSTGIGAGHAHHNEPGAGTHQHGTTHQHHAGGLKNTANTTDADVTGTHPLEEGYVPSAHAVNSGIGGTSNPTGTGYTGNTDPLNSYGNDSYHLANHHHSNPVPTGVSTAHASTHGDPYRDVNTENPSTMSGKKDQAMGAVKQTIGSTFNKPSLEAQGAGQRTDGHIQENVAKSQPGTTNSPTELNGPSPRGQSDAQYNPTHGSRVF